MKCRQDVHRNVRPVRCAIKAGQRAIRWLDCDVTAQVSLLVAGHVPPFAVRSKQTTGLPASDVRASLHPYNVGQIKERGRSHQRGRKSTTFAEQCV